jgi:two-component system chemotaxis response regulator CheB
MSSEPHRVRVSETDQDSDHPGHERASAALVDRGQGGYRLVVMAASMGGIKAIGKVLSALSPDFPLPIAVVLHRSTRLPYFQDQVLASRTPLKVRVAKDFETMRPGTVYLAPPDRHLKVRGDKFMLTDGRKIRHVLSSANPLFESAAEALGGGVIAVVLTGYDSDATDGVQSVKANGGFVIAQDEQTSEVFGMPHEAIKTGCVDRVLPLEEIGPALNDLVDHARDSAHG